MTLPTEMSSMANLPCPLAKSDAHRAARWRTQCQGNSWTSQAEHHQNRLLACYEGAAGYAPTLGVSANVSYWTRDHLRLDLARQPADAVPRSPFVGTTQASSAFAMT